MAAVTTESVIVSHNTATALDVVPAVAKTKIAVYGFVIVAGAASAQTLIWQSKTTPTPHFGPVELPRVIGESINVMSPSTDIPLFVTLPGEALQIKLSAATAVAGTLIFRRIPA